MINRVISELNPRSGSDHWVDPLSWIGVWPGQGPINPLGPVNSALVANPNRHQHRLHQAASTVVIVGVEGEPQHVTQESEGESGEEKFGHA